MKTLGKGGEGLFKFSFFESKILYDSTYVRYLVIFIETESRMVGGSGWREGGIGSCLIGREFVFQDEKNSGCWLHNSVNVPNTTDLFQ